MPRKKSSYPKKKSKIQKRTHKQAFENKIQNEERPFKKIYNQPNTKENEILKILDLSEKTSKEEEIQNNNDKLEKKEKGKIHAITTDKLNIKKEIDFDEIYSYLKIRDESIYTEKKNLNLFHNFEYDAFNQINVIGDGNCLYRCISYHLYGTQNYHNKIRSETYQYIKNNTTFVYEYCYLENNKYYIDIETGKRKIKHKYFIEDYIENIKKDGFFGGFIELYIISKLYNAPILIMIKEEKNGLIYFKKLMLYDNSEFEEIKLENIIFLYFINDNHYDYLEPNIRLLKKKINALNNKDTNLELPNNIRIGNNKCKRM